MDTPRTVSFSAQVLVSLDELALAALALDQVRDEVERRRQLRIHHDARLALYRAARALDDGAGGVPLAERLRAYDEDPMGVMRSPVDDETFFADAVRVTMPAMVYLMRTRRAAYYGLAEAGMLRIATVARIPWAALQQRTGRDLLSELATKMINIQSRSQFSMPAPRQLPAPASTPEDIAAGPGGLSPAIADAHALIVPMVDGEGVSVDPIAEGMPDPVAMAAGVTDPIAEAAGVADPVALAAGVEDPVMAAAAAVAIGEEAVAEAEAGEAPGAPSEPEAWGGGAEGAQAPEPANETVAPVIDTSDVITVIEKRVVLPETMPAPAAETTDVTETAAVAESTVVPVVVTETTVVAESTVVAETHVVAETNGHGHVAPVLELDAVVSSVGSSESAPS